MISWNSTSHFKNDRFVDEVIKKAEAKLNTFSSPEKENRQTQTPETVKRKFFQTNNLGRL